MNNLFVDAGNNVCSQCGFTWVKFGYQFEGMSPSSLAIVFLYLLWFSYNKILYQ